MYQSELNHRARRQRHLQSIVPSSWFATSELTPAERFEAWRQSMSVFLDPSLGDRDAAASFAAEIEGYLLDDIVFSRGRASCQKFDRQSLKIARDGLEHYMIQLFFYGHMEMNLHGRTIRNRPGQIVGFDLGEIMDSVNSDFDMLCVIVPRARLAPFLAQPDSLHGLIPAVDDGSGLLLANYMRTLYRAAPMLSPAEASASAHALLDLIASAFNNAAMGRDNGYERRRQFLLLRAQQFIRDNLGSPRLSPEYIATNIGVSRSSLYQVFEPVGGIAEYIRELRLRKCLTEIVGAHSTSTRIGEIGFRWGFGNPSAFTRSFKQRFGRTPSEARELGYTQTRRAATSIDPRAGNRLHEEWIAGLT